MTYDVLPDVGTAAWNSCAGVAAVGPADRPALRRRGVADLGVARGRARRCSATRGCGCGSRRPQPVAFVSAKLSDVFPDGTSSLLSRGLLNLTHRDVVDRARAAAGRRVARRRDRARGDVLDARRPGHRLRLSVAGVDWPNTLAPPRPLTLTIDRAPSSLQLPLAGESTPTTDPLILWTPTHHSDGVSGDGESTKEAAGGDHARIPVRGSPGGWSATCWVIAPSASSTTAASTRSTDGSVVRALRRPGLGGHRVVRAGRRVIRGLHGPLAGGHRPLARRAAVDRRPSTLRRRADASRPGATASRSRRVAGSGRSNETSRDRTQSPLVGAACGGCRHRPLFDKKETRVSDVTPIRWGIIGTGGIARCLRDATCG